MDIDSWLRSLGLGQYEAAFRDNAIDEKVLPRLTAEDLKDLGVGLVGHRRTLLDAIAALRGDANAKEPPSEALPHAPASSQASAPPATVAPTAEAVGERRYLTVMFCDLVGSTGISAQLDAEEWRDLVGAYLDAASAAVTEMGGHVAKKLGDGLMSLFGYPVAHENDAERAARAALAIQRALAELNRKNAGIGKPVLTARIGLDAGPAVVDAAGEIYGDVANIAARVQALAEPGAVLVTARVQRQVAGLFVAEERGTHTLKGVPEPSALFQLVRASGGGRRSGAAQSHAAGRPRRRNGDADAALGAGAAGRRPTGDDRGRAGVGQIPPDRGISCPALRHAAHLGRMELLTASAEHAATSGRRMGPPALRRRRRCCGAAARGAGEFAGVGQARPGGECVIARAAPRHSAAPATGGDVVPLPRKSVGVPSAGPLIHATRSNTAAAGFSRLSLREHRGNSRG